jgi:hypothetical protein
MNHKRRAISILQSGTHHSPLTIQYSSLFSLSCSMFLQKHITTNNLLPYFLNLIAAGEGSLPDY